MSPSPKKPTAVSTARRSPATASTKVVRAKTPAERVAEKFNPKVGIVANYRLEAIRSRLRGLGMPSEEVSRIMAEIHASLGVEP